MGKKDTWVRTYFPSWNWVPTQTTLSKKESTMFPEVGSRLQKELQEPRHQGPFASWVLSPFISHICSLLLFPRGATTLFFMEVALLCWQEMLTGSCPSLVPPWTAGKDAHWLSLNHTFQLDCFEAPGMEPHLAYRLSSWRKDRGRAGWQTSNYNDSHGDDCPDLTIFCSGPMGSGGL